MAMVCPRCNASYAQRLQCPECDLRLTFAEGDAPPGLTSSANWQQTAWGRILIGLLLSQGIYYGLRHFLVAGVMASKAADPKELWGSVGGLILLLSMQILGLFVGGLLAGAGQRQGLAYGAVLGVWNGLMLILVHPEQVQLIEPMVLYSVPLIQAVLGAVAGLVGSLIWRPLTPAAPPGASRQLLKKVARPNPLKYFVGPVYWTRVIVGTAAAVGGTLWAGVILDKVIQVSAYSLSPETALQAQIVTWEIAALAILGGGALAGAATTNGLTQGLAVGLATTVLLVGIRIVSPHPPTFLVLLSAMMGPVILGVMGGGFGSKLLPPIPAEQARCRDAY